MNGLLNFSSLALRSCLTVADIFQSPFAQWWDHSLTTHTHMHGRMRAQNLPFDKCSLDDGKMIWSWLRNYSLGCYTRFSKIFVCVLYVILRAQWPVTPIYLKNLMMITHNVAMDNFPRDKQRIRGIALIYRDHASFSIIKNSSHHPQECW